MDEILINNPINGVLQITLNRPERLNSFTFPMYKILTDTLEGLRLRPDVRVVILTGQGRAFCSGHDISPDTPKPEFVPADLGEMQMKTMVNAELARIPILIQQIPQPVICAVNGVTAGIGYALALAADLAIGSDTAKFINAIHNAATGTELGMSWLLPRIVGTRQAAEILYTARAIEAEEATRIGLILRSVPSEKLQEAALELARQISVNVPLGITMTKRSLWANQNVATLEHAIEIETRACIIAQATADAKEKRSAFLEKRAPSFSNR